MKSLKSILALSFLFLTATSSLVCSDGLERKDLNEDVVKTVVVSPNGAANFKTIQEAIDYIPSGNSNWIKIILSPGIYNEKIVIPKEKQKIIMQGNSASEVTIQYNDAGLSNSSGPITVNAEYFVAINITFKNCVINVKGVTSKGVVKGGGMLPGFITAQGRENEKETSGFVFKNCVINGDGMASLGRAYRGYSRVVFYETNIANIIVPQGWDAWDYKGQEDKFTYAEVNCIGEGANKSGRVMWEKNLSAQEIDFLIEPKTFIDEDGWMGSLPSSLVSLLSPSSIF
ncbi:putative pectinesterase 10 [Cardamine amara subsp. amara]|uniref:pectinesterase n=1 Tax=Cardamine amara subsp. amara TaxID=228776 RepID=A0ABD0ZI96_CARAN